MHTIELMFHHQRGTLPKQPAPASAPAPAAKPKRARKAKASK